MGDIAAFQVISELARGAGILLALVFVISWSNRNIISDSDTRKVIQGFLYGSAAVIGISFPLELSPGIIFDARTVVLSVASAIGGPIVGAVSALLAGAYRLYLGGDGAVIGVYTILTSASIGLLYWNKFTRYRKKPSYWTSSAFGFFVHIVAAFGFAFLPLPLPDILEIIVLPMLIAFTPATVILLRILSNEENINALNEEVAKNNSDIELISEKHAKFLIDTIDAISKTIETRDPYTAGHQENVAKLSVSIAERLNWNLESINGLKLGAMVHDLGKIHIPSDILNKPGKLSVNEMALIQEHPQVGYQILSDIDFPWPVAKMVLQHHERIDGSGYPSGLTGADIIDEARILAVADVVDAMTSHRPYRPALGVERAIDEIRLGRGKKYDESIVDACIEVLSDHELDPLPEKAV